MSACHFLLVPVQQGQRRLRHRPKVMVPWRSRQTTQASMVAATAAAGRRCRGCRLLGEVFAASPASARAEAHSTSTVRRLAL